MPGPWKTWTIGQSVEGRSIRAWRKQDGENHTVIVLGGVHGDEPKSVFVARRLIEWLGDNPDLGTDARWVVVPLVNPDGYDRRLRRNANRVDLNRNFPTDNWQRTRKRSRMFGGDTPAGEPETRAVIRLVEKTQPAAILTIHSIGLNRHCNNYDGPGRDLAEAMSGHNGYPVTATIGYPTPGSFGTWAGVQLGIPTVTLELPSRHSPKRCWEDNRTALACAADHGIIAAS